MSDDLVFYTNPQSRGRIARWMLEEVGQPYRTEIVAYGPAMKSPEYLAINPMGKVPALRHGDTVITETAAICAYLADAFPEAQLAPLINNRQRGSYYRWLFFAAGPFEAAVFNKAMGFEVPQERRGTSGYGSYGTVLDVLERGITACGDYLVGGSFTAADLYVGAHLGFGLQFGTLEKRPAFERYWARLNARPAKQRADQIDNQLAAQQQASSPSAPSGKASAKS
jgi:glutathione S-transferase